MSTIVHGKKIKALFETWKWGKYRTSNYHIMIYLGTCKYLSENRNTSNEKCALSVVSNLHGMNTYRFSDIILHCYLAVWYVALCHSLNLMWQKLSLRKCLKMTLLKGSEVFVTNVILRSLSRVPKQICITPFKFANDVALSLSVINIAAACEQIVRPPNHLLHLMHAFFRYVK